MLNLSTLDIPKAADVLAEVLREQILDGQLGEGSTLPSERALAEQSGLSRATVREALLILELDGLVLTRTGRKGGTEVVRPRSERVQRSIRTFIRGQGVRLNLCCKRARPLSRSRPAWPPCTTRPMTGRG
jgi:DNA-binding FadR family transcriptional regulator